MKMSKTSKPVQTVNTREEATLVLTNAAGDTLDFDAIWDQDGSIQVIESRTPDSFNDFMKEFYKTGFDLQSVRIHLDGHSECGADVSAQSRPPSGQHTTPAEFAAAVASRPAPPEARRVLG